MADDWMKPITKPLPGPVPSEAMQLTPEERATIAAVARPVDLRTRLQPLSAGDQGKDPACLTPALSQLHTRTVEE